MHSPISPIIKTGPSVPNGDPYFFCSETNNSDSDFQVEKQIKKLPSRIKKKEAITRIKAIAKVIKTSSDEYSPPIAVKKQRKKFFLSARPSAIKPAVINPNLSPIVLSQAKRELPTSSPEVLRDGSPANPVLQEIQNSPTKVDEEPVKSKIYTNRSVKGIKCLESVLSKENATVSKSPQKKCDSASLQVPQNYLTSKFLNSTCAATTGYSYAQPQDWNVSAISRRLTSTSELSEEGLSSAIGYIQKPKFLCEEKPLHKEIPHITYRKVIIRKPLKVEKDIYNFTSESDTDFELLRCSRLRRKPAIEVDIPRPEEPVVSSSGSIVSSCSPTTLLGNTSVNRSDPMGNFTPTKGLAMPADKDVIVITDDDVEDNIKTGKRSKLNSDSIENPVLLQYKQISICEKDYESLEEGEFLNDNIIEYYLTYLKDEVLTPDDRPKVYVFSTHFYGCLTKAKKFMEFERDKTLSEPQKQYKRVERWTKNINLFDKDMVIFPICEESHWLLIIAIKPGLIKIPENSEERIIKGEPFFILLDSMGGGKEKLVSKIRQYMTEEYKAKTGGTETFSKRNVRSVKPHKPEQMNFTDCGLYLLQYVEKMFECVAQFYFPKLPDLTNWFPQGEIQVKRYQMALHIQNMASTQKPGKKIHFPPIKLNKTPSKAKRRKSRYNYDEEMYDLEAFTDCFDRPSSKRKKSLRKKKSPERHNKSQRSKDTSTTNPGHGTESGEEDSQEEFGDPLLSAKQKLAQSYKIPRRGDNLTSSDQIMGKLEAVEKEDFPEVNNKDKVNAKEKKNKHKAKENASDNKTVIDPITREKLPVGEVPDADILEAYKGTSKNKAQSNSATSSTTDGKDFKRFLNQRESAEKGKADKEAFSKYLNKKSRKQENVAAAAAVNGSSHSQPYNCEKYKDSRENSPNKKVKRSSRRHNNNGSTLPGNSKLEPPQVKNNGGIDMKSEVKGERSKLMKRKSQSLVMQQLKNDWSDSCSEPSPSRRRRQPVSKNGREDSPFYPSLPSVPKDKTTPDNHQTTSKSKSSTKSTGTQHTITINGCSKLMKKRTKIHRSLKSKAKVALDSTSTCQPNQLVRGNPGKLFTESTTSLSSSTADLSVDLKSSPGRFGGQLLRAAKLAVTTTGVNQGFRLFSERSSTSSRRSSSIGDVSS